MEYRSMSVFPRTLRAPPRSRCLPKSARAVAVGQTRTAPTVDRTRSCNPFRSPRAFSSRDLGHGWRAKDSATHDAQSFAGRVGQPFLPAFLSVVFDPTQARLGPAELAGHYLYDDEGVKAQRVTVVDKGVLKTFLLSRRPLKSFPNSNGHGRGQTGLAPVSRQSNLLVESTQIVPHEKLIAMLKEEARKQGKTYGLLFDNIQGGFTFTGRDVPNAFTVMPLVVYRIHTDDRPMNWYGAST